MDSIAFSAVTLDGMLQLKMPQSVVLSYLKQQSASYSTIISGDSTGLYSYYDGKYLDGDGWEPPDTYIPLLRPWYIAAKLYDGEIVLSEPYSDSQTSKIILSVSKLLADGRSVVSMDVSVEELSNIVKQSSRNDVVKAIFVLTSDGFAIAHSNEEKAGKNLYNQGDMFDVKLLEKFNSENSENFSVKHEKRKYTVFTKSVISDWSVFVVLDNEKLYKSIYLLYVNFGIVLFIILGVLISVFIFMDKKYSESELLTRDIKAVADNYVAVARLNLITGDMKVVRNSKNLEYALGGCFKNYAGRIQNFVDVIASESFVPIVTEFMEPLTLEARLSKVKTISLEYVDRQGKWMRMRYFIVDRTQNGELHHVMVAFESIDEDRRQQEALRRIAETDAMTGVNNRGSGEQKIREALKSGKHGMFCLIDVDKFKSINDNYGHQAGDESLKAIAASLSNVFRESDIVFRLGGDEFAAFAEGVTTHEIGERILNRVFERLEMVNIPALKDRKVTISVGASFFPKTNIDSFEAVYRRADEGTYESKKHDGNFFTFIE
ncbi:MAG: diguanylate cyclase [Treponema sp.]|nr:diguanylate cyclase [Treponema sp.]